MGKITAIVAVLLGMVNGLSALSCLQCGTFTCAPVPPCRGDITKDPCGCCDVCAKIEGEGCGGPWDISGKCSSGLTCVIDPDDPLGSFNAAGTCECPAHSTWNPCGSACPTTCETLGTNVICPEICVPGCTCDDGYVLKNGSCVLQDQCGETEPTSEPPCPPHSEWNECGSACPATCADPSSAQPCLAVCAPRCVCVDGYVLDDGDCIPVDQCSSDGCDYEGEQYNDGDEWAVRDSPGLVCQCEGTEVVCYVIDCAPGYIHVIGRNGLWTCQRQTACPVGYVRRPGIRSCYKLVTETPSSYRAAEQQCFQEGAQLVTVKSKKIHEFLRRAARSLARADVWIGLSVDRVTEGTLTWSDGDEYIKRKRRRNNKFWAKRAVQQNTPGNDCVYMSRRDKYYWRFGNCGDERMFICEFVLA